MTGVVFVLGPTASGKSALALGLAEEFGGDILNCDSLQACRRLDIGTAKPTPAERARVPHHLFDVVAPGERFTAGDFRRLALSELARRDPAAGPTFAVGGSGFYVRALERGMFDVAPPRPETEARVRERLARAGGAALYAELSTRDPDYAAVLSPNDVYRVGRALMMMDDAGRRVSELRAEFRPAEFPYPKLKLGLNPPREILEPRVRARTARMLADGLLDETRRLIDEGFGSWPALASVGYRECAAVARGEAAADDLPELITRSTLALVKKQRTWFKKDAEITWLDDAAAAPRARELIRSFIDAFRAPS